MKDAKIERLTEALAVAEFTLERAEKRVKDMLNGGEVELTALLQDIQVAKAYIYDRH